MREGSLIAAVIISALLFGAVEPWSIALVSILVALAFASFALTADKDGFNVAGAKGLVISMSLFLLYPLFQLVPLPVPVIGAGQERFRDIITLAPKAVPAFHSISVYPFATEMDFSRLLLYGMVFSAAAFGTRERDSARRIIRALAVFGFGLALFGIVQHAAGNGKIYWLRELTHGGSPFGPFVNRNHFAGFVGMIIPLSLGIALGSKRTERKMMFGFFAVVMALGLFFSLSRGGIISFFAGLLVFSFVSFTRGRSKKKLIPVFLFVLVLAVYLLSLGVSPIIERFAGTEVSGEQRLVAWQGTLSAIRDFSLFGSGLGTFQHLFKVYQPDGLALYWDHAHNDYLELLLEAGIIGTLLAAAFFLFLFRIIVRVEWRGRDIYLGAGFLASITTMALHSIVDFNLHIPSNAILFSLILGLAAAFSRGKKPLMAHEAQGGSREASIKNVRHETAHEK
jgi:O-antigen ligase